MSEPSESTPVAWGAFRDLRDEARFLRRKRRPRLLDEPFTSQELVRALEANRDDRDAFEKIVAGDGEAVGLRVSRFHPNEVGHFDALRDYFGRSLEQGFSGLRAAGWKPPGVPPELLVTRASRGERIRRPMALPSSSSRPRFRSAMSPSWQLISPTGS